MAEQQKIQIDKFKKERAKEILKRIENGHPKG